MSVCDDDDAKKSACEEDELLMMSFSMDVIEILRSLHAIMRENSNDNVEASFCSDPLSLHLCVIKMMPFDLSNNVTMMMLRSLHGIMCAIVVERTNVTIYWISTSPAPCILRPSTI